MTQDEIRKDVKEVFRREIIPASEGYLRLVNLHFNFFLYSALAEIAKRDKRNSVRR